MNFITIDYESLGLRPNSTMLELGYTIYQHESEEILKTNSIIIPEEYSKRFCAPPDFNTVAWWLTKSQESNTLFRYLLGLIEQCRARSQLMLIDDIHSMLFDIRDYNVSQIWCTDKSFDYAAFLFMLDNLKLTNPFSYNNAFETRAFKTLSHPKLFPPMSKGVAHTAQDDSLYLAQCVSNLLVVL